MTDFRSDKKFTSTGTVTDGYDTYVDRQDGIDTLVSKDVNDLADSIQEVQKSIIDGYAVTDYLPNAVAFTDGQTIVYDSVSGKMIAGDASGGASGYELVEITGNQTLTDTLYENVLFFLNSASDLTITINQNTTFNNCKFFKPGATLFWSSSFTTTFNGCDFNILNSFDFSGSFNALFKACNIHINSTFVAGNINMERCSIVASTFQSIGSGTFTFAGTKINVSTFFILNSKIINIFFGSQVTVDNFYCPASPTINLNYSKLHIGKTTGNGAMSATLQYASEMKIRSAQTHFSTLIVDDTTNDATHLWIGEYKDTTVSTVNKLSNNDVITTLDESQNIKGYEFIGGDLINAGVELRTLSGTVSFPSNETIENVCFYSNDPAITFDLSNNTFRNCTFYTTSTLTINSSSTAKFEGCEFRSQNGGLTFNCTGADVFIYSSVLNYGNNRTILIDASAALMYQTQVTAYELSWATTSLNQMQTCVLNLTEMTTTNVGQASTSMFLQQCNLYSSNINDSGLPLDIRNSGGQLNCNFFRTSNTGTYIRSENHGVSKIKIIFNSTVNGHGCIQVTEFNSTLGEVFIGQVRGSDINITETSGTPIYKMVVDRDYGVKFLGLNNVSAPMTGTYTPTITGNNGFTVGDTIQPATWVKIGNKVRVTGNFRAWSSTSTGSVQVSISLPFTTTTTPGDGNASISATSSNNSATTTTSGVWFSSSNNTSTTIALGIRSQGAVAQYASFDFTYTQTD